VVGNEDKRKQFDAYGPNFEQMGGAGPGDFAGFGGPGGNPFGGGGVDPREFFSQFASQFGSMFEDGPRGGAGGGRRGATRGSDIDVKLKLDFMEAVKGCTKTVEVDRMKACKTCSGSGAQPGTKPERCKHCRGTGSVTMASGPYILSTACPKCGGQGQSSTACKPCRGSGAEKERASIALTIPAGVANGQTLRMSNQGNVASEPGRPAGHLWAVVEVADHPVFQRDGTDVHVYCSIPVSQACLGGQAVVPTLTGEVDLKIPAGSRAGDRLVMRSKGISKGSNGNFGNQYVHLDIAVPKELTPRQRELMEEFAKIEDEQTKAAEAANKGNGGKGDGASSWFSRFKDLLSKRKDAER
jgi:molecular chaperone DnaJ